MKKVLMILAMVFALSVCCYASDYDFASVDPEELGKIDVDTLTEDELKEAYKELRTTYSILYDLYVKAISENGGSGTNDQASTATQAEEPKTAKKAAAIWEKKYYVDQFGDKTEDPYITNKDYFTGTFSNTVVTDEEGCNVTLLVDKEKTSFKLFIYETQPVKNPLSTSMEYDVILRSASGEEKSFTGTINGSGDRISIRNGSILKYHKMFVDFMKQNEGQGDVRVLIQNRKSKTEKYKFTIPAYSGFEELYDDMKKNK